MPGYSTCMAISRRHVMGREAVRSMASTSGCLSTACCASPPCMHCSLLSGAGSIRSPRAATEVPSRRPEVRPMNRVSLLRAAHGLRAMCRTLRAVAALVAPLACVLPWAAQATQPPAGAYPPIVFLHGNGDMASQWQTQLWRIESNGWPRERPLALRHPFPLARTQDDVPQAGRSSAAEHMAFLAAAVERIGQVAGGQKVVLVGNSRGGTAIRNYIVNGGGAGKVSHAILGGTPNHGVWAIPGYLEGSEFSGLSPLLRQLNAPKNADGDEVTGPVQWMTLRSDNNDRYAQPDGRWLKLPGQPTYVGHDSPALRGAH